MNFSGGPTRVGCDVEAVATIQDALSRYGERYTRRIYTEHELACCQGPDEAAGLTARFAAKEATIKALRPTSVVPRWTSIEVRRQPGGWTELELHDEAAEVAVAAGIQTMSVSLSHGGGIGAAIVVAHLTDLNKEHG